MVEPFKWHEEMTEDWKKTNEAYRIFSHASVVQIESFGKSVLKRLGFKNMNRSTHSFAPGLVYTEVPYSQGPHLDFDERTLSALQKSWIIHMPLQKEGMILSIWEPAINGGEEVDAKHQHVFVPFGSYIALRSDVLHSGMYGSPGNSRFHLILKSRNQVQVAPSCNGGVGQIPDCVHYHAMILDQNRCSWRTVFHSERKRYRCFTDNYISQLQENSGKGVMDSLLTCKNIKALKKIPKSVQRF